MGLCRERWLEREPRPSSRAWRSDRGRRSERAADRSLRTLSTEREVAREGARDPRAGYCCGWS